MALSGSEWFLVVLGGYQCLSVITVYGEVECLHVYSYWHLSSIAPKSSTKRLALLQLYRYTHTQVACQLADIHELFEFPKE